MLNSWLHLIALAVYVGAVVGLWAMLLPAASKIENHKDKLPFLVRSLKLYNPIQIGKQLGYNLGIKLFVAFFLVLFSVYQSMGIAHRFVKRHEAGDTITSQEFDSVIRKLKSSNGLILMLALITLWFGLRLRS